MRNFVGLFFVVMFTLQGWGQTTYSLVEIDPSEEYLLVELLQEGLDADHFIRNENGKIETVIPIEEIVWLDQKGINCQIIIPDLSAHYAQNLQRDLSNISQRNACGLQNFDTGGMGGYHTYNEMVMHLDSMRHLFPQLITAKQQIGTSIEGRPIWAVKISDHPELNESLTEPAVYADALTHAREPISLEVTLYFMWWLLENYGTDPEATYLVNEREIFLVPVVNPDGYVFNEMTHPNGGGLWRKNRRFDSVGNVCYGIDLNRNFSFGWGDGGGSSNDPCSNTFRGTTPFSEPETQAIQTYLDSINPVIAFSIHSYGNKFLNPLGFRDSVVNYDIYAELAGECIPPYYSGYGTVKQMLNYTSSGTTRDYFHINGIYGWTPEVGSSFWDAPSTICRQVQAFLKSFKTISWAAGACAKFQNADAGIAISGQTFDMELRLKNIGLTRDAQNVSVSLKPLTNNVQVLNQTAIIPAIGPQKRMSRTFQLKVKPNAGFLEPMTFQVEVQQEGVISDIDTLTFYTGNQQGLLMESFEQGKTLWQTSSTGLLWDTTYIAQCDGNVSIADSRYGNYQANASSFLTLKSPIDLQNSHFPKLEFWAKWSLEPYRDYLYVEVKKTNENVWKQVPGTFGYNYTGHHPWMREQIDLSAFKDQLINLRFHLQSDFVVQGDGVYIDDLRIVDYTEWATGFSEDLLGMNVSISPNPNNGIFSLNIDAEKRGEMTLTLLDLSGQQMRLPKKILFMAGSQAIPVNLDKPASGVYLLAIETEGRRDVLKMIIE
ncbi:MAG: M14 family zinc carboxypeptidase [Bacteroidia bacterium]